MNSCIFFEEAIWSWDEELKLKITEDGLISETGVLKIFLTLYLDRGVGKIQRFEKGCLQLQ